MANRSRATTSEDAILPVPPGIHALSNHSLNEPWPKVEKAKSLMGAAIGELSVQTPHQSLSLDVLTELLSDTSRPQMMHCPIRAWDWNGRRGVIADLDCGEKYGTRSSTLLSMHRNGTVTLIERT